VSLLDVKITNISQALTLGLGMDVVEIKRIEHSLNRFGQRFIQRIFTPQEQALAEQRTESLRAATYAKRFAAKEAVLKALGTGYWGKIKWQDIEITRSDKGKPSVTLSGEALIIAQAQCPEGFSPFFLLSLSDTIKEAHAIALFQAVKLNP
jgi:holo-[acyl-carrier protein] synthase